ncbi:phage portal protein [Companilactobacillus zhachilii]|uniref:Phage portal protein n=1 Tax=Companilactobacillus zhachilii TaxID=2304606 RepID=A0A386PUN7_9LACO|nr:phage portal protein [Companilactobacillus zhachilii]AYE38413.1 phage portal protein [Companilactobacillus zhachilii]
MAIEDNPMAYYSSLPYPDQRTIHMLSGRRFSLESNKQYKMPQEIFDALKKNSVKLGEVATQFIEKHQALQVPRLLTLYRYYIGDNDIHYWDSEKSDSRADNRIASGFAHFITSIKTGYRFGNNIKFQYNEDSDTSKDDEDKLNDLIADFNSKNDESYHEKIMGKNLSIMGRAYELMYVRENTNEVALRPVNPANAFVVYDSSMEQHSLFAVYYYNINFNQQDYWYTVIYTDDHIYYYKPTSDYDGQLTLLRSEEHSFGSVPITEYINNDERMGDWEYKLDTIDAIDKSKSEMANSQEDFSNAMLMITGDIDVPKTPWVGADGQPLKDEDGHILYKKKPQIDTHQSKIWLKPALVKSGINDNSQVVQPTASYLTKELNSDGWKLYIDALNMEIHKDTNTPDTSDANFASNASGVAMSYKLWGSDQERSNQESLYTRGIMRRMRLLGNYWQKLNDIKDASMVENINPIYTPNLPKNDAEIMQTVTALVNTGKVSDQTILEQIEPITGVSYESEKERNEDDTEEAQKSNPFNKVFNRKSDDNQEPESDDSDSKEVDSDETNEESSD